MHSRTEWRTTSLATILGLAAMLAALFAAPALAADAQFGHGSVHIDWTPVDGPRGSMDLPLLPVYPPPGSGSDPLMLEGDAYGWGLSKNYRVGPPGAEWNVDDSGYMQFLFGDVSKPAGPMFWIFGPAQLGAYPPFASSRDIGLVLRLPDEPHFAENHSEGLSDICNMTIRGDPSNRLDGSFVCTGLAGIEVAGVTPPPVIDASGTFSVYAPGVGDGPPLIPIVVAGGGVAGVGGVVVWRRRRRKKGGTATDRAVPPPPPVKVAPLIPPPCTAIGQRLDQTEETVVTLREAINDIGTTLLRAERIHRSNLIKARMVVNLEIIKTLGATATDVALAMRPGVLRRVAVDGIGQVDTWSPPTNIDPRLATLIERMTTTVETALTKLRTLAGQVEELRTSVEAVVSEVPAVAAQRAVVADAQAILDQDLRDLAVCGPLRQQLNDLDPERQLAADYLGSLYNTRPTLQKAVEDLRPPLHKARNDLAFFQGLTPRDLAQAEKDLADLHAANADTIRISSAAERVEELRIELSDKMRRPDAAQAAAAARDIEAKFAQAEANLAAFNKLVSDAEANSGRLSARVDELHAQILKNRDVYPGDIDQQKQILAAAQQREGDMATQVRQRVNSALTAKEAELYQAELEATQAKAVLEDAREAAAEEAKRQAAAGRSTETQWTWRYPFQIASEIIFGVGQSPEEIVEVLRRDIVNIKTMRNHITDLRASLTQAQATRNTLRGQLAACLAANGVNPDSVLTPHTLEPGAGAGAPAGAGSAQPA